MKKLSLFKVILSFSISLTTLAQHPELQMIDANKVEGHMRFLADDLLKGRAIGSEGFQIASSYVQSQLISIGLKPAADNGSFVQSVLFKNAVVTTTHSFLEIDSETLTWGSQFILSPYYENSKSEIEASMVFVGFGVSSPEFNYDDYEGLNVAGKIVVYINGAPDTFPSNEKAYYSTNDVKFQTALKNGAVGVIRFMHPDNKIKPWLSTVSRTKNGRLKWVDSTGSIPSSYPELKAVATFNQDSLANLFRLKYSQFLKSLSSLNNSKPSSFEMDSKAKIHIETETKNVVCHNLLAEIKGSDPNLKDEYLVYSAHLDHLGIGRVINGDSIYNGAHDNASGVSILLEIARTFKNANQPPKRSILFALVTAEESGLLGSDYLAHFPPEGKEKMIANINMDMPFLFHPILDIVPYGAAHSSLGRITKKAADYLHLDIAPDPFPEQVVFIRSDHYSFIKIGIPALYIKSGFKSIPEDSIDRRITDVQWRKTHYHRPQDDMNQDFDFNAATTHVKINYLIGKMVANDQKAPYWKDGDFFGGKMRD
ncbi:MAG: hypothetical protein ACJARG_000420 [Arcticibacterium sp.]|jgi:hypothetical protein